MNGERSAASTPLQLAEAIAVGENFLQRHRGQRATRGELHVAVKAVLVLLDGVQGEFGVNDAEPDDDADAQGDLVRGKDFLAFDGKVALAHVHEFDLDQRLRSEKQQTFERDFVATGFEDFGEHAVFVPKSTMGVLDDDFEFVAAHVASPNWCPEAGPMFEYGLEQICIC